MIILLLKHTLPILDFTDPLHGLTENVKLFGSTINDSYNFHVQSYAFCMKSDTFKYLIEKGIFRKELNCNKADF